MRILFNSMPVVFNSIPEAVLFCVMASWLVFVLAFGLRKRPPKSSETKRDPTSFLGIALQGLGYGITWAIPRQYFTPIVAMPRALEFALAIVTAAIAAVSVWLCAAAIRTLGKQWTYVARVVEGHKLITQGPYRIVRNPIYAGMFGMLVATGLAVGRWWVMLIAVILFWIGNSIRIRSEEKLLHETFGAEFEDYRRRVPAMFPRLF
jgi:protein-S-isoprenylcysteine O-methyltransferase Ste14